MLKTILKKVKKIDITANNKINSLFSGNYRSVFYGRGIEFADLRPYVFGDDVRDIDWKSTSKQGEVYIKKYHETRNNTLFFVIDMSPNVNFSSQKNKKFESILETFAILAFEASRNGDRVGVIFSGLKKAKIFPPKKGRRNILKILAEAIQEYENISKKRTTEKFNSYFPKEIKKTLKLLKHSSVILWLSSYIPNLNTKETTIFQKSIKMVKSKNDFIPIFFSDKEEINLTERGQIDFYDPITTKTSVIVITEELASEYNKIYNQKRICLLSFFRKYNMETIFMDDPKRIFKELLIFFKKRQKHLI